MRSTSRCGAKSLRPTSARSGSSSPTVASVIVANPRAPRALLRPREQRIADRRIRRRRARGRATRRERRSRRSGRPRRATQLSSPTAKPGRAHRSRRSSNVTSEMPSVRAAADVEQLVDAVQVGQASHRGSRSRRNGTSSRAGHRKLLHVDWSAVSRMSPLHSCSICSSTFAEGEGLTLDVSSTGSSRRIGGYCRVRCRDAARALLALGRARGRRVARAAGAARPGRSGAARQVAAR